MSVRRFSANILLRRRKPGSGGIALILAGTGALFLHLSTLHPTLPWIITDSASYLNYGPMRPHGYSWMLSLHQAAFGGLHHLPAMQALLFALALALLCVAVAKRFESVPAGLAVLALTAMTLNTELLGTVMADWPYMAWVVAAAGFILLAQRLPSAGWVAAAATCIGLAITFRTVGFLLLPCFALFVLLQCLRPGVRRGRLIAAAVLPVLALCAAAAASNQIRHGRFEIGSYGGMSLLGKGLVLAAPLPEGERLAFLNPVADLMTPARQTLERTDGFVLRALIARQYYEYLRWNVGLKALADRWPDLYAGDEARTGRLAGELAATYISRDPRGYLHLVALDYFSLWALPRYLTDGEQRRLVAEMEALGPLPYLSDFAKTDTGRTDYFQIVPAALGGGYVWACRMAVALFLCVSAIVAWRAIRTRGAESDRMADIIFLLLSIHITYAVTALVEGGLERYTLPTWPLLTAAAIGGILALSSPRAARTRRPGSVRTGMPMAVAAASPVTRLEPLQGWADAPTQIRRERREPELDDLGRGPPA